MAYLNTSVTNTTTAVVSLFEYWSGQLVRPQKVLDTYTRLGRTGSVAQIVYTKGPDCSITAAILAQTATVKTKLTALNDLQGTMVSIIDKDETYERVLCRGALCSSRAIEPTQRGSLDATQYDWIIMCSFIFEVQPED